MEKNSSLKLTGEERGNDGYVESSAEYILPDYNPDVRKLLYTFCEVKPAGKFSSDEQTDFSGIVEYRVLYSDKDGELCEISFTSDYEYGIPLTGGNVDVDSLPWVQNYQIRVLGPRKISAKASILCENIYTLEKDIDSDSIPYGDDIELERENARIGRIRRQESEERELAEEISRLDGVSIDEITVISALCECVKTDFERSGNEGRCKSEFAVRLLYRDMDGSVIPIESVLSGEGVVTIDGIPEGANVICRPVIMSERFECLPTDYGVNIVANLIVKWETTCVYNEEHSVITDGYSTDFAMENKYSNLNLITYDEPFKVSLAREGVFSFDSAECGRLKEVLLFTERGRITEKRVEDGCLNLSIELKMQGVVSSSDANSNTIYSCMKISENITEKVNLNSQNRKNNGAIVRLSNVDMIQKIDGNDIKYTITAELEVIPYSESSVRILSAAERNEKEGVEKKVGRVTVYYTEPGDTIFTVAKKYHTTTASILRDNEITVETVGGIDRTVLPKRLIIY